MKSQNGHRVVARSVAVVTVLAFLGVLLWMLSQPGYSQSRLVLFVLIGGAAVIGAVGVVLRWFAVTVVGVGSLFMFGFWQAVLSVFIYPVIGLFLLAAFLEYDERISETAI